MLAQDVREENFSPVSKQQPVHEDVSAGCTRGDLRDRCEYQELCEDVCAGCARGDLRDRANIKIYAKMFAQNSREEKARGGAVCARQESAKRTKKRLPGAISVLFGESPGSLF